MPMLSLSRIVAFWAGIQPGRVAIDHEGASVTWDELDERTNRLARAHEELGVARDDVVTIGLPTGTESIHAFFAPWTPGPPPSVTPSIVHNHLLH